MLKIFGKRGEIAPQEQFLLFSTIFCNIILDFYAKTRTRFSLRDKRLFEITEVEITRVDCIYFRHIYVRIILQSANNLYFEILSKMKFLEKAVLHNLELPAILYSSDYQGRGLSPL